MPRGLFIVVEGIDKAGGGTHVPLLVKGLRKLGYNVEVIAFPDYATPTGKELKAFFSGKRKYDLRVRHMLLAVNRWERKDTIEKWLAEGKMVVANRYSASNYAYGASAGLDMEWLAALEKGLPEPDVTILIDIPTQISVARLKRGRDLFERDRRLLEGARNAYLELAKRQNWRVIDGDRPAQAVQADIRETAEKLLKER